MSYQVKPKKNQAKGMGAYGTKINGESANGQDLEAYDPLLLMNTKKDITTQLSKIQ